ncbi:MAG: lipase family protein, partial [Aquihabitans sp.]
RPGRRPRVMVLMLGLLAVVTVSVGCSKDSATKTADQGPKVVTSTTTKEGANEPAATSAPVDAPAPEQYTGTDEEFYRVPDPLPAGRPGQLIRVQQLGEKDGYVNLKVMYHSVDGRDRDRAVTGIITYPTAAAPKGGWPVVSTARGTSGLSSACAVSRAGAAAPGYGIEGVHVASDYIGLGPIGERQPYLSGPSEAHAVIDAVRAAQLLPDAHASTRWLAVGHSQGGHSALFTNQLAASYAPELELLGTVSSAPAAAVDRTFGPDDQVVPRMVGIMALYGIAEDNPEIKVDEYIGDQVAAVDDVVSTGCTDDIVNAMVGIPADVFYKANPIDTEPARSVMLANDPGQVKADSPLLFIYGDKDWWVVPDRVEYVFQKVCKVGQVADMVLVPGADHGTVVAMGGETITRFLQARLDGDPPVNACTTKGK